MLGSSLEAWGSSGVVGDEGNGRRIIRLFYGWADSPVWVPGGPISYEDSRLSVELVMDLKTWESRFYGADVREAGELSGGSGGSFGREGIELTVRLAAEVGSGFAVVTACEDGVDRAFHTTEPALNPEACEAFDQRFNEEAAESALLHGGVFEAHAPVSGAVFNPRSRNRRSRRNR